MPQEQPRQENPIVIKLKYVYLPYLAIALISLFGYGLLRCYLDVELGLLDDINTIYLDFVIPLAVSILPMLILMRNRVKILILSKNKPYHFELTLLMGLAVAAPMLISQEYIKNAFYDLYTYDSVTEVKDVHEQKFIHINDYEINRDGSAPLVMTKTSGKRNRDLDLFVYFACPFEPENSNVWYGLKFTKTVSNSLSEEEKEAELSAFMDMALIDFENWDFKGHATYFEKIPYSINKERYLEAITQNFPGTNPGVHMILVPHEEPFEARLGSTPKWMFLSFGIGALVILLLVVFPSMNEEKYRELTAG